MLRMEGVELIARDRRGARTLLSGAELSVASGEVQVIFGDSGSGKSSLLSLLAGLMVPQAGVVSAMGRDLGRLRKSSLRRLRRRLSLIEESPNFLEEQTAFANVAIALEIQALAPAELRAAAAEALAVVGLADRVDVPAGRLSRSERLWLAVARAIARKPAVVLADEPWRELGELGRDRFCNLIDQLAAEGAACIVTTSEHAMVELAELWSWSVTELRDGVLVPFHEVAAVESSDAIDISFEPEPDTEPNISIGAAAGLAEVLPFPIRAEASGAN